MERKFDKPHPELEGFIEPHKGLLWLVDAFFRLHRRRQLTESGFQPISIKDASDFSNHVLGLSGVSKDLFFRVIEDTDNLVLLDHYQKTKAEAEKTKANTSGRGRRKGRKR